MGSSDTRFRIILRIFQRYEKENGRRFLYMNIPIYVEACELERLKNLENSAN